MNRTGLAVATSLSLLLLFSGCTAWRDAWRDAWRESPGEQGDPNAPPKTATERPDSTVATAPTPAPGAPKDPPKPEPTKPVAAAPTPPAGAPKDPPKPPDSTKPPLRVEVVHETGALLVRSPREPVEVFLNDQRLGEAGPEKRLRVPDVAVGTYRLRAQREGFKPYEQPVRVTANQLTEVFVDIDALGLAERIRAADGATMVLIPAGVFSMGIVGDEIRSLVKKCVDRRGPKAKEDCEATYRDQQPLHRVTLNAFYMDEHEVTNVRFKQFVERTKYSTTAEQKKSSVVWFIARDGSPNEREARDASWLSLNGPPSQMDPSHPVVHVSWKDALAFCTQLGLRLPTEAEWERAARREVSGGTAGSKYPWGNDFFHTLANSSHAKQLGTMPVGSYPDGRSHSGVYDLAGNVAEWVNDFYDPEYYVRSPGTNPRGPETGKQRVIRGGSWIDGETGVMATFRGYDAPDATSNTVGFRCVKSAP